jgi:rhodanese-related sulfurtransferase
MPKPVLFLDFDRGALRAVQANRPDVVNVSDFGQFYQSLMSADFKTFIQSNGYCSIVVDTVGAMLDDFASNYLVRLDRKNGNAAGGLSLQGWGAMGTLFNSIRNRFMELGLNVCFIAHAKDAGEDAVARMDLAIKGGSSDIVVRVSDQIGFMYMEGQHRTIDFSPSQMHLGKDTGNISKVAVPSPEAPAYATYLQAICEAVNAKMFAETTAQLQARETIETYRAEIAFAETPEEFADGHIAGAVNIPVQSSDFSARVAQLDPNATYAVYCRSGNRSQPAVAAMADAGITTRSGHIECGTTIRVRRNLLEGSQRRHRNHPIAVSGRANERKAAVTCCCDHHHTGRAHLVDHLLVGG